MILPGTLKRLREQDATIYRVDTPAQTVTIIGSADIDAYSEVFATRKQADARVASFESCLIRGGKVTPVKARDHSDAFLKDWKDYAPKA